MSVSNFVRVLVTEYGECFAKNVEHLTCVPFNSSSASVVLSIFYNRAFPNNRKDLRTSLIGSEIKNSTDGKHDFNSFSKDVWKIKTIERLPKGIEFSSETFNYIPESNGFVSRFNLARKLTGDGLIQALVDNYSEDVKTNKYSNAKRQFKKYFSVNPDEDLSWLKEIDIDNFPIWFGRDECKYLCELIRSGKSFHEACKIVNKHVFFYDHDDIESIYTVKKSEARIALDNIFESVKEKTIVPVFSSKKEAQKEYVYFAVLNSDLIKVGGSKSDENLEKRLKDHHHSHPETSCIKVCQVRSYIQVEKVIKAVFCANFDIASFKYKDPNKKSELGQGEYFSIDKSNHSRAIELFDKCIDLVPKT
ncbi:hypothetical protein RII68_004732 [Vibrio parahaemolyticus]|uniref:hypothetical protein n=2 Tax=Vibrio parahaemolyticus TaxID=670 RepID=UPI0003FD39D6|nr:hypothetical protein [Vibrio parahaemolyticus]EGR1768201.1 hypothetical protein [Vibrio parahaemolyticus]EIO3966847.1 hypothetical protein [Vibrio parahaemolyticus]EIO3989714.1 hypothetical protein [Vibrio parahaemolyticus]ELA9842220.1 hypothetical protein [Vibrio parahaemolyticus]ELC0708270.1 hypothetical protein [Vibrio parahaemolyticus]